MMSATRAICPSIVLARCSGSAPTGMPLFPFEWRAMPSRTSHVRFSPGAIVLEHVDDAQALLVVVEPAGDELAEDAFSGMAEGRVTQIVPERDRLGQLFVEAQHLGDAARDLRDLEGVRQPRPVMIAGRREEDLRLVLQAAEGLAVDHAVAIALEGRPNRILRLRPQPAAAVGALGGLRREDLAFALLELLADDHGVDARSAAWEAISPRKLLPPGSAATPNRSASV